MKKITLPALFLFSLTVFFCCKTIRPVAPDELVYTDEISDYLRSANVYMRNSNTVYHLENTRVSGDSVYGKPSRKKEKKNKRSDLVLFTDRNLNPGDTTSQGELVLTKNEIRKATFSDLRERLRNQQGDDDTTTGLAIGLVILLFLVAILILAGLIYLLAVGASNASANSNSNSGCYVATMVYGDYDAPEVMVLRKFRDQTLSRSAAGRAFIRWYYNWSPGFVKKYNHLNWLHRIIRFVLDRFVKFLS